MNVRLLNNLIIGIHAILMHVYYNLHAVCLQPFFLLQPRHQITRNEIRLMTYVAVNIQLSVISPYQLFLLQTECNNAMETYTLYIIQFPFYRPMISLYSETRKHKHGYMWIGI